MRDIDLWPKVWAVEHSRFGEAPEARLIIGPCSEVEALDTADVLLNGMPVEALELWQMRSCGPA